MLAYIFWHRPHASSDAGRYEDALLRFHRGLSEQPPPGFGGAASYRIPGVPWLADRAGYEDWCYVDGSWALDPLNGFAVAGHAKGPHDEAAAEMEVGYGGLYGRMWGTPDLPNRHHVTWLTRPRGIDWRAELEPVRGRFPDAVCWRRQMVFGPAPEFAVVIPSGQEAIAPPGWQARYVIGERLLPTGAS
ncbi:MAG: hypothetical protein ACREFD_05885 [Stellaceae bacterium]